MTRIPTTRQTCESARRKKKEKKGFRRGEGKELGFEDNAGTATATHRAYDRPDEKLLAAVRRFFGNPLAGWEAAGKPGVGRGVLVRRKVELGLGSIQLGYQGGSCR